MRNLVSFTLKQAVFINIVFVILMTAGIYSMLTTPMENLPPVAIGKVFINTVYYGASADDVEQLVTREIEDALDDLENVEYIQSSSMRNVSSILVKFIDDTDYLHLYNELRLRILNIRAQLPEAVDDPVFTYLDTKSWIPVIIANVSGELPNRSLTLLAEELQTRVEAIPGVQEAQLQGDDIREFHVALDPWKLRTNGLTFNQVCQAIRDANSVIPSGRYRHGASNILLDTGTTMDSRAAVLDIPVALADRRNPIRVRDLATSADLSRRDPDVITSVNGHNAVQLRIKKEDRANAVTIAEQVKALATAFDREHSAEHIHTVLTYDSTIEIDDSVSTLSGNMVLGMALVTLILWLTLGFRNAMLTAIGIPFSFLVTLVIIRLTGQSINTISLFSFVLVSGIIVDDAVIMIENIYRHLQMGKKRRIAVIDGVAEVFLPVTSSALTTVLAFTPMLIMSGSTGEFFSVIPMAVSYALLASLLEALFILPIHVLDFGPRQHLPTNPGTQAAIAPARPQQNDYHHLRHGVFAPLWRLYEKLLHFLLQHKILSLGCTMLLFITAVLMMWLSTSGIMPLIRVKFFEDSYLRYHVAIELPAGTAVETTDRVVRDISTYLVGLGPGKTLAANGSAGLYEDRDYSVHRAQHYGQVVVTLPQQADLDIPEYANQVSVFIDAVNAQLQQFAAASAPAWGNVPRLNVFGENTGPPTGKAVNIRLTAPDIAQARHASDALLEWMRTAPELADLVNLDDDRADMQEILQFSIRRERALEFGLDSSSARAMIAGALNGALVGEYRTVDDEIDLLVKMARREKLPHNGLGNPRDIMALPLLEHSSGPVRIGDLAELRHLREPDNRSRYNGNPAITISADIREGSKLSANRVQFLAQRRFSSIAPQFSGVSVAFGGEFESTGRAYRSLAAAFIIAVLAIYLVLATQFNSYLQPVIILSAIGFAFIGVVFGMFFTRSVFTISSFMAVIGLAGVAVNDSLILIDFMNKKRLQDLPLRQAVIAGCSARMRPVLITTATTILGMLPMALGIPHKSITWAPMATAFVTGLSSATLLALLIIPVEYELVAELKQRLLQRKRAQLRRRNKPMETQSMKQP